MPELQTLDHGVLHVNSIPCEQLQHVAACGDATSMFAHSIPVTHCLPAEIVDLFHQQHDNGSVLKIICLTKTPDGYIFHNEVGNILAAAHAPGLHGTGDDKFLQGDATLYVVAKPPNSDISHFKLRLDNGNCLPHEISRCSIMQHVLAQLHGAVPLEHNPRCIFKSKAMGTLMGRMLQGVDATTLKALAVGHLNNCNESMYHKRLMLPPQMKQLLMMRSEQFSIRCAPCADGVVMYRQQRDTLKHILVSFANSSDFGADNIDTSDFSNAQVYKVNYDNSDANVRIFVKPEGQEYEANEISLGWTIQTILNKIEEITRNALLEENNYHLFPILAHSTRHMRKAQELFHDPIHGGKVKVKKHHKHHGG